MNPNTQPGFNPDQNPFAGIMQQAQSQGMQAPAPTGMPAGMTDPTDPSLPGQTGDSAKPLIVAIKALHDYIAMSTDVRTQNMIRNLITMLNQLMTKEQEEGAKKGESVLNRGGNAPQMPTPPQV